MKERNLISVLFYLHLFFHVISGTSAQGISKVGKKNLQFECPIECPPGVYRPICSRGKSYANLCVLKQQICEGNTALEIYKDVEACPKYDKDEDAKGASIELIDKNGVIFRTLFDSPRVPNANEISSSSSSAGKKGKSSDRRSRKGRKYGESTRSLYKLCRLLAPRN